MNIKSSPYKMFNNKIYLLSNRPFNNAGKDKKLLTESGSDSPGTLHFRTDSDWLCHYQQFRSAYLSACHSHWHTTGPWIIVLETIVSQKKMKSYEENRY